LISAQVCCARCAAFFLGKEYDPAARPAPPGDGDLRVEGRRLYPKTEAFDRAERGLRAADDDGGDDGGDRAARDDRRRRRRRARDRRRDRRRLRDDDDDDDDDDYWARRLPPAAAEPRRARPRPEPLDAPTDDQRRMANHLALQGHRVELRGPEGSPRRLRDADRHGGSRGSRDFRGDRGRGDQALFAPPPPLLRRDDDSREPPRPPRAPSPARARSPGRYYGRDRGRDDGRLFATEPFRPQPPAADEAGFPDTPPRFFRDYRRRDFDDDRHRYRSNPPSPYGYRTDPVDGFPAPLRRSAFHD